MDQTTSRKQDTEGSYIKANLPEWFKRLSRFSLLYILGQVMLKSSSPDNKGHVTQKHTIQTLNFLKALYDQYGTTVNKGKRQKTIFLFLL